MHSKAQIVATIGPATREKEVVRKMIENNMSIARLNLSWGTYEEHAGYIKNIREVAKELGKKIPIIQDLSGPRIQEQLGHKFNEGVLEIITEKDLVDLKFGIEQGVDYVAMSYVGSAGDILKLREKMKGFGKIIPIIAKIERKSALTNIDEIIGATDSIMVARGDLGNEIPVEQIPFVQKDIIDRCKKAGKPVIVATQMMISMMENPEPTRAEVADISCAISSGADAVMLSEETAIGKYPLQAVTMMGRVAREAEKHLKDFKINSL